MNVLILGHKGMLGHMVLSFLKSKDINCHICDDRWPDPSFQESIIDYTGNFIINCIGAIPQRTDDFSINYKLPVLLDLLSHAECKIIHPGSDCEGDNTAYGESKKIASNWIKSNSRKTKIIKTSIIGPELSSNHGLMEWFLSQEKEVNGYSKCFWNGNTTLTWAKYSYEMINNWNSYGNETILQSESISKFQLLKIIKEVYGKNITIKKNDGPIANRCLYGGISTQNIKSQLIELKKEQEHGAN
jgi:dTDP-4-dehydrorhamnose reductase